MKKQKKSLSCRISLILAAIFAVGICLASCTAAPIDDTPVIPDLLVSLPVDDGLTDGDMTVYLDETAGSDENDGLSADTAFATIEAAFAALDAAPERNKTLVISGSVTLNDELPVNRNMIKITSDGFDGSQLVYGKDGIWVSGPLTFENIHFQITSKNKFINACGNKIVLGEGVTKSSNDGVPDAFNFHAGVYNDDGQKENVTVHSDIDTLHLGSYHNDETRAVEGASVTVNGGTLFNLSLGTDGWTSSQKGVVYTDTVTVTLNGGAVNEISARTDSRAPMFECALQFIANYGLSLPEIPEVSPVGGLYVLSCEDNEGAALRATAKEGCFEVVGGKTAVATDESGKTYTSASGLLKVPAGNYTVSFTDIALYTNSGKRIVILEKQELDLAEVYVSEPEGELFLGWKYENGKEIEGNSFKKGAVLAAQYADFDVNSDFTPAEAVIFAGDEYSLVFSFDTSEALDVLDIAERGIIYAPTNEIGTQKLSLDSEFEGLQKIAVTDNEMKSFSVAVGGITEENCRENYTACGYITYRDLLGKENTIYSTDTTANFYNLAISALEESTLPEDERNELSALVENVKSKIKEEYFSKEKIDVVGTSEDEKTWIYRLGEGGIMVREVDIDTGSDEEPTEIVQITDLHFNYCNERDFEEANPSIMATYAGRKWLANGKSVPNAVSCLDFASFADQVVVTGDILDYMSWGCIELTKKHVFDPYPTIMATLGNHEATRRCQDTPKTPDPTTLESRMEILQENWIHDIYYYSKIVNDRVMLIQLDNGTASKFWDSQVEPFKKDLELAREKGYTVLIFYHIPLCTNNPAETDLYPIRRNDSNNYNFMENGIGNASTEGASKEVYDLIVNNADIIKGAFCGHKHSDYYTEIIAKNADGTDAVIPQYILTGTPYEQGHALVITVK